MGSSGIDAKRLIKKIPWLFIGPFFYLLFRLSFLWPAFTENVYSRGIYRVLSQGISTITGLLPFSLGEILLYAFILFVATYLVFTIIKSAAARKNWWFELINKVLGLLCVASVIYALFVGLWGFNYSRETLGSILRLDTSPSKVSELYSTCEALIDRAKGLRETVPEDAGGVFSPDFTKEDMMKKAPYYYNKAAAATGNGLLSGSYGRAKPVLYSTGLSYANIGGIFFPFTGEANLNADAPMLYFPSSTLHEAAHQIGFSREDEANFLAYYVSSYSEDTSVEYSGTMLAVSESMHKLYSEDRDLYFELRSAYSESMDRDLKSNALYWMAFDTPIKETSRAVNNTFLQANMQHDGVKSYGRMVDLLIALWRSGGL